jgi:hypothetical protein
MMLPLLSAEAGTEGRIADCCRRIRPVDLTAKTQRADERDSSGIRIGTEGNSRGKAERAAENCHVRVRRLMWRGCNILIH